MARSLTDPSEGHGENEDPVEGSGNSRPSGVVRSEPSAFSLAHGAAPAFARAPDGAAPAFARAPDGARRPLGFEMSGSVREQDEAAPDFERVYVEYFQRVSHWVRAFGGLDAELDDLTQEVFLVVERRLADFRGGSMAAWLYGIARKTVSDQRRRAWFRRWLRGVDPDQLQAQGAATDPGETLERREARRVLASILNQLSAVRRSTFILFEIEGYSGEEIAVLEGVSVNTVYTRLHHARKDFFRLLAARNKSGAAP
jgi:RNA polymerase sigma-70 factor (ECF subfamily)